MLSLWEMLRPSFLSHCGGPDTAFSPARHLRPLAPIIDVLRLLKGACNWSSFLHLLYRKEKIRHLVLFELLWTVFPSLKKRCIILLYIEGLFYVFYFLRLFFFLSVSSST